MNIKFVFASIFTCGAWIVSVLYIVCGARSNVVLAVLCRRCASTSGNEIAPIHTLRTAAATAMAKI